MKRRTLYLIGAAAAAGGAYWYFTRSKAAAPSSPSSPTPTRPEPRPRAPGPSPDDEPDAFEPDTVPPTDAREDLMLDRDPRAPLEYDEPPDDEPDVMAPAPTSIWAGSIPVSDIRVAYKRGIYY